MTTLQSLRRVLREVSPVLGHARTRRAPWAETRQPPVTPRTVDGWFNFHADSTHRTYRR